MSKKEKSCSSPMLFRHSMSIAQQLMPIYNNTVHENKMNVALYLMWLTVGCYETSKRPQGWNSNYSINKKKIWQCYQVFKRVTQITIFARERSQSYPRQTYTCISIFKTKKRPKMPTILLTLCLIC